MPYRKPAVTIGLALSMGCLPISAARAAEGFSPIQPGVTTGIAIGSLPPPGFYITGDSFAAWGKLKDNDGKSLPVSVSNFGEGVTALWSSPYHILGAQYGAAIIGIAQSQGLDARGVGGTKSRGFRAFNTLIKPLILSWKVQDGLYASLGFVTAVPIGSIKDRDGVRQPTGFANGFWTFEPSASISYMKNGWNLTLNNIYDFNTRNKNTDYYSGQIYYLDWTAEKSFGTFSIGAVGDYTRQTQDDRQGGAVVGNGNRIEHILAGPLLTYRFRNLKISAKYLANIRTRNDMGISFFHVSLDTRF